MAPRPGYDINYVSIAGVLDMVGRPGQRPVVAPAMLGDLAGGGMLMAIGVSAALYERERSGLGQVLDAAIVDGAALLTTMFHGMRAQGRWPGERGENLVDGGSCYDTYETADGGFVAVGAMEPQFFAELTTMLGIDTATMPPHLDPSGWSIWKQLLAEKFRERTRDEWAKLFEDTDACVTPVLSAWEAPHHPHHIARRSFVEVGGVCQPAPAPRFDRTPAASSRPLRDYGSDVDTLLAEWHSTLQSACQST